MRRTKTFSQGGQIDRLNEEFHGQVVLFCYEPGVLRIRSLQAASGAWASLRRCRFLPHTQSAGREDKDRQQEAMRDLMRYR